LLLTLEILVQHLTPIATLGTVSTVSYLLRHRNHGRPVNPKRGFDSKVVDEEACESRIKLITSLG